MVWRDTLKANMPGPKFVQGGETVPCVRASVLLHPRLHTLAKKKAASVGKSLSDYIAGLVGADRNWPRRKAEV